MFQHLIVEERFPGKITKASDWLLVLIALGTYSLPDGRPLLDHVVFLDTFLECGRYVEAGDGETTPELLAKKRNAARLLILAAELWTIFLYLHNPQSSQERGGTQSSVTAAERRGIFRCELEGS